MTPNPHTPTRNYARQAVFSPFEYKAPPGHYFHVANGTTHNYKRYKHLDVFLMKRRKWWFDKTIAHHEALDASSVKWAMVSCVLAFNKRKEMEDLIGLYPPKSIDK